MRSIEADEGSTDTRSACDSREAEGVLNEHRRDRNRIGPKEFFVNLSRGRRLQKWDGLREELAHFAENPGKLLLAKRTQFLDDERRVNRKDLCQLDDGYSRQHPVD